MSDYEVRQQALELAVRVVTGTIGKTPLPLDLAQSFYEFLSGVGGPQPEAEETQPDPKPVTRRGRGKASPATDVEPVSSSEQPTEDVQSAEQSEPEPEPDTGDDLVGEPERVIEVSEVNAAVLAACKPGAIGKDRVVALLTEHGSTGGVPGLPKANYGAFLDALANAS